MKTRVKAPAVLLAFLIAVVFSASVLAAPLDLEKARAQKIVAVWQFADEAQMKEAFGEHLDVLEFEYGRSMKFLTDAAELDELRKRGYDIEVEIPDIVEYNQSRLAATGMGGYRTFDDIVLALDTLHNLNPAITTEKFSIGQTIEGREMWVMKISDNPEIDEDEPESFFDAAIHAREVITPLVLIESMRSLITGYGVDTFLTRLVDTREIFFLPCVNPDGYHYNEVVAPDGGGMWRKNRRVNGDGSFGVDLNRNFTYQWGYDDIWSSPIPEAATFRGTAPGSEPEVQNYMDFVESREFTVNISFHSYANKILWPYGYAYDIYSPDEPLFAIIGDSMSEFNNYTAYIGWSWYPTNGCSIDWCYGEQTVKNKIFSYIIEIGGDTDGFWPPTDRIPQLVGENIPAVMYLIDISVNPCAQAPPLAPEWTVPDTVPTGFFDLTWSQPDDPSMIASFDILELSEIQIGTDDGESGTGRWTMDGFIATALRKYEGSYSYYSGAGNELNRRMTTVCPLPITGSQTLEFYTFFNIQEGWDYAYVEVSTEDTTGFNPVPGNITTTYDPNGKNRGNGITGSSSGWKLAQFDLSAYSGQSIYLRISYITDESITKDGFYADVITPIPQFGQIDILADDFTDSTYAVKGRPAGEYYFRVCTNDIEGQTGPYSSIARVIVETNILYGDMDNSDLINPVDVIWLVNMVYRSGPGPLIQGAQYINGDAQCNPVDVIYLVNYVYRGGAPPLGYGE